MFVIGMVNYKTSLYIETQLKIYKNFAGSEFEIIIVDNSRNNDEWKSLRKICRRFTIPIKTIKYGTPQKSSSESHGEGLQYIYNLIKNRNDVDCLLTQDPDFFWVRPNFLKLLEDKLKTHATVGAPYHFALPVASGGHPWFPAAFGAAYRMSVLREIEADFRGKDDNKQVIKDVGWQVRDRLSSRPYLSFEQESFDPIGTYSFEMIPRKYLFNNETIAYHLHRGSFETHAQHVESWAKGRIHYQEHLRAMQAPQEWQENRKKMCDFFWQEINNESNL